MVTFAGALQPGFELYNSTDQSGNNAGIGGFFGEVGVGLNFSDHSGSYDSESDTLLLLNGKIGSDSFDGDKPQSNTPVDVGLKLLITFTPQVDLTRSFDLTTVTTTSLAFKAGYRLNSDPQLRDHAYFGAEMGSKLLGAPYKNITVNPTIGFTLGITAQKNAQFFDGSSVYAGLTFIVVP